VELSLERGWRRSRRHGCAFASPHSIRGGDEHGKTNSIDEQAQIRIPAEDAYRALLPEMEALSEAELVSPRSTS
jgi:hypothetical protein